MKLTEFIFWLYLASNSIGLLVVIIGLIKKAVTTRSFHRDMVNRLYEKVDEMEMTLNDFMDKKQS